MPIYEYECPNCGRRKELMRPLREMEHPVYCDGPICSEPRKGQPKFQHLMRRVPTAPAPQFPGANRW